MSDFVTPPNSITQSTAEDKMVVDDDENAAANEVNGSVAEEGEEIDMIEEDGESNDDDCIDEDGLEIVAEIVSTDDKYNEEDEDDWLNSLTEWGVNPGKVVNGQVFTNTPYVTFQGDTSVYLSTEDTKFKNLTLTCEGNDANFIFDTCVWNNVKIIMKGESCYLFNDCKFINCSFIGEEGLVLEQEIAFTEHSNYIFNGSTMNNCTVTKIGGDVENEPEGIVYKSENKNELSITQCVFIGTLEEVDVGEHVVAQDIAQELCSLNIQ